MSEPKFTKGEWSYVKHDGIVYDDKLEIICDVMTTGEEYEEANAHLIASAPAMYAMLKNVLDNYDNDTHLDNMLTVLLAKARGE